MEHSPHGLTKEQIQKHVRIYISVFVALAFLTIVTVTISYLHLSLRAAVFVALSVALVKGSLVACFFMHMLTEKATIFLVLLFTVIFFAGVLLLPVLSHVLA